MTYAGARGNTEKQMASVLHFDLSQLRLHPAFNWLDKELSERGVDAGGQDKEGFLLKVANAIWGQQDYEFKVSFLDILAENYGAGLRVLDFINQAEPSRLTINDWVSEQTEDKIKDLISPGGINSLTRLVLSNAIYFNADWEHQFLAISIRDSPFYLLDKQSITVPMMKQLETFGYVKGDKYQAVELPYKGGQASMVILMPSEGKFSEFESNLDYQVVDDILNRLDSCRLILTMPKFKYISDFKLGKVLSTQGMPDAFSSSADFSGITGNPGLFISDVIHKAFVSVDEKGTEAAAATAVMMAGSGSPHKVQEPITVTIDHPFIFMIRDIDTGTLLFLGRVVNPNN